MTIPLGALADCAVWQPVYVAGPMTNYENYNYHTFYAVANVLRSSGYKNVCNPAEHFNGEQGHDWTTYLSTALEAVMECAAGVLLPGWESSPGARLEAAVLIARGCDLYDAVGTGDDYRFIKREIPSARVEVAGLLGMTTTPVEDLPHEEAHRLVHGARQNTYGHPLDNFTSTANIWNGILHRKLSQPVTAEDVALCMTGVKLSREAHLPKRDNRVDAHGYLMTYDMVIDERDRRATD